MGSLAQRYHIIRRLPLIWCVVALIITFVASEYNGFVAIGSLELNNALNFFLNETITSICIVSIFDRMLKNTNNMEIEFLNKFGKNTIVVVCTNNLLIEIVRLLDYKITESALLKIGVIGAIILFFLIVYFECVLIELSNGIMTPMFGKSVKLRGK